MIGDVAAIGTLFGLIVSVVLLTWQTRAVARQAEITNSISAAEALNDALSGLRDVYRIYIDRPNIKAYFYANKALPRGASRRVRVLTLAEMLADCLETGLITTFLLRSAQSSEDWRNYCRFLLDHSPALRCLLRRHPDWWPHLVAVTTHSLPARTPSAVVRR